MDFILNKPKLLKHTKDFAKIVTVILLGFLLILAILFIKYKPQYGTTLAANIQSKLKSDNEIVDSQENSEENNESNEVNENDKTEDENINENQNVEVENEIANQNDEQNSESVNSQDGNSEVVEVENSTESSEETSNSEAIATINDIRISVLPVTGKISSRYGESSSRRVSLHTGLDIACATGTNIKVVANGTVTFSEYKGSYGNLIKVDHGNGVETWYGHCSKLIAKVGDTVKAGDIIGLVGSTGNSTGPHLHFEIRVNGETVNPQNYMY